MERATACKYDSMERGVLHAAHMKLVCSYRRAAAVAAAMGLERTNSRHFCSTLR